MPCREQSGDTSVDYQCERPDVDCDQETKEVQVCFGVSGGIVVVDVSGSICVPFDVPNGCGTTDPNLDQQACLPAEGVQFTQFPGDEKELRKHDCQDFNSYTCKEQNVTFTITVPQAVIDWLKEQFPGASVPSPFTIPWPTKECVRDTTTLQTFTCPGTNGGQTWFEVVDETCYPD
jgi:hypothetical protein